MPLMVASCAQAAKRFFSARGAWSVSGFAAPGPGESGTWLTVIPGVAETGTGRGKGGGAGSGGALFIPGVAETGTGRGKGDGAGSGGALFIATFASSALSARNGSIRPYPNWLSRPFGPRSRAVE